MGMGRLLINGGFCGFFGLRPSADRTAKHAVGSLRCPVSDAAAQAPSTPDPYPPRTRT